MAIKRKLAKFSPFFQSAMVVLVASLFVMSVVYAATTIGSNITTAGNLDVEGTASTTSATSTAYIDIGVQPDGGVTLVNWAGGDLYVQDDLEVDDDANIADLLTVARATTSRVTSTAMISVGSFFTPPAQGFDFTEDLAVSGNTLLNGVATSVTALWIGSAGTANNINLAGGDLYVQNDVEIDGTLYVPTIASATTTDSLKVGGYATVAGDMIVNGGTFDLTTGTATTTDGLFVRTGAVGTSTVSIGDLEYGKQPGCLEMVRESVNGQYTYYHCWITTAGTGLECTPGRCRDGVANLNP